MYNFTLTRIRIEKSNCVSLLRLNKRNTFNGSNVKVVNNLCFFTLIIKLCWFL